MGEEDEDAADSGDHAIDDEALEISFADCAADGAAEPFEGTFHPAHGNFCESEDGPEDREHERCENRPASERVERVGIDAVGEFEGCFVGALQTSFNSAVDVFEADLLDELLGLRSCLGDVHEAVGDGMTRASFLGSPGGFFDGFFEFGGPFPEAPRRTGEGMTESVLELGNAATRGRADGDEGNSEVLTQSGGVNAESLPFGAVHFV